MRTIGCSIAIWLLALTMAGSGWCEQTAADRMISRYQAAVSASPGDCANYDQLGTAFLLKGRETSDFTYYQLAEKAVTRSLQMACSQTSAIGPLTHLAAICMAEHRFSDAAAYARRALAAGSGDLTPYAVLGDAYADMGEYDKASEAYAKLRLPGQPPQQVRGLSYMYSSRVSYLKFLFGDTAAAIAMMREAARLALEAHLPPENIAWTYAQLGEEFFQAGDLADAQAAHTQALAQYTGYYRGLGGLAKVRAAQGSFEDAVELYKKAVAAVPLPEYVAALGDLYSKLGRQDEARTQYELVEYIGYLSALNKVAFNRELAIFYADHELKLNQSLDLANKELRVRRDVYTWDALAWSLYKNGKPQEAVRAMNKALSLGTRDALLFFHAGMIYRTIGEVGRAEDFFRRALAINPHFHTIYADIARHAVREIEPRPVVAASRSDAPVPEPHLQPIRDAAAAGTPVTLSGGSR